jgi:hypothetical protein
MLCCLLILIIVTAGHRINPVTLKPPTTQHLTYTIRLLQIHMAFCFIHLQIG